MAGTLADCFTRTYAITRPERRKELLVELAAQKVWTQTRRLVLRPEIRPDTSDGFPNPDIRGCFLSHLDILRRALHERLESVLVLEDDVKFSPFFRERLGAIRGELRDQDWGFAYLGHGLHLDPSPDGRCLVPARGYIGTAHCYGLHRSVIPAVVDFLETLLTRPPGHPDGGPMSIGRAMPFFRERHPQLVTLAAAPSLASQRLSRTGLPPRWLDRFPGLLRVFRKARRSA